MGSLAALAVVQPVGLAWACVAPVSLTTSSPTVQPGGMVHIIGRETAPGAPIEIHLDAPTGPILTTVTGQARRDDQQVGVGRAHHGQPQHELRRAQGHHLRRH